VDVGARGAIRRLGRGVIPVVHACARCSRRFRRG
jgi:hypothetical protein